MTCSYLWLAHWMTILTESCSSFTSVEFFALNFQNMKSFTVFHTAAPPQSPLNRNHFSPQQSHTQKPMIQAILREISFRFCFFFFSFWAFRCDFIDGWKTVNANAQSIVCCKTITNWMSWRIFLKSKSPKRCVCCDRSMDTVCDPNCYVGQTVDNWIKCVRWLL